MGAKRLLRKTAFLWTASAGTLAAFVIASFFLQNSLQNLTPEGPATFQSHQADRRLSMDIDWSYALDTGSRAPGDLPSPPESGWQPFDPASNWSRHWNDQQRFGFDFSSGFGLLATAPLLNDRVWAKKEFQIKYPIQNPAIVLGHVPGDYRIYLNGHLVNEFAASEAVGYAPIDSAYFQLDQTNQVLLSIHETAAPYHGFATLPEIGSFIGEFNDVRQTVGYGIVKPTLSTIAFFAITCGALAVTLMYSLSKALGGLAQSAAQNLDAPISMGPHETQDAGERQLTPPQAQGARDVPVLVLPEAAAASAFDLSHSPVQKELGEIHKKIASLVKSARSTLYVTVYSERQPAWFEAASIVGDATLIRRKRPIDDELLGTAVKARKPWLIRDIGDVLKMGSRKEYQTRSCMIIPLMISSRLSDNPHILGALTLADKDNSVAFTEADLALAVEACHQIIQLLDAYPIIRSRLA